MFKDKRYKVQKEKHIHENGHMECTAHGNGDYRNKEETQRHEDNPWRILDTLVKSGEKGKSEGRNNNNNTTRLF